MTTKAIDAELRRMGFKPETIKIRGRVFMAALAENIRLRGQIDELLKLRRENLKGRKAR